MFFRSGGGEPVDVTSRLVWGGDPVARYDDGYWRIRLKRWKMRRKGLYQIRLLSGNELDYTIEPTCEEFVEFPRRWRHRHLDDDDQAALAETRR